eukprot:gene19890-21832_t
MNSVSKKILVTGGSGYVGSFILKYLAAKYPTYQLYSLNRSGKTRDNKIAKLKQIKTIKGNCLQPETFQDILEGCDGIIHSVGTLVGKGTGSDPESHQSLNRDSCINVATLFDEVSTSDQSRRFVMISSEKGPPFIDDYIKNKREAEEFLLMQLNNIKPTIIRPGFITSQTERPWSIPLKYAVDVGFQVNERLLKKIPGGQMLDYFMPAKSVMLETVAEAAVQSVNGDIDADVIGNDALNEYQSTRKWTI